MNNFKSEYPNLFSKQTWNNITCEFIPCDDWPDPELISNVNIIPFTENGWVTIQLENGLWEIPGGTLEPGESHIDAIDREIMEEVGAIMKTFVPVGYWKCVSSSKQPHRSHLPHPEFFRVVGCGEIEIVDKPLNGDGKEKVAFVEELTLGEIEENFLQINRPEIAELFKFTASNPANIISTKNLQVIVNTSRNLDELKRKLKHSIYMFSIGISTTNPYSGEWPPYTSPIEFDPASNQKVTIEEGVEEFKLWILTSAICDIVESINLYLDGTHEVALLYSLGFSSDGIKFQDLMRVSLKNGKSFNKGGMFNKFSKMSSQFNIDFDQTLKANVLSLNNARNCLVHRLGLVSDDDIDENGFLQVSWQVINIYRLDEEGNEHLFIPPERIESETQFVQRKVTVSKSFKLGERITFSKEEAIGIAFGTALFGIDVALKVREYGKNKGFPFS